MNNYGQYELRLTDHSYTRYLERIGPIDRRFLRQWCTDQVKAHNYSVRKKRQLIIVDDVWFAYEIEFEQLIFTSCYGRSHMDLEKAIVWAERHNDSIVLDRQAL